MPLLPLYLPLYLLLSALTAAFWCAVMRGAARLGCPAGSLPRPAGGFVSSFHSSEVSDGH
jgi:hypothetical protein